MQPKRSFYIVNKWYQWLRSGDAVIIYKPFSHHIRMLLKTADPQAPDLS